MGQGKSELDMCYLPIIKLHTMKLYKFIAHDLVHIFFTNSNESIARKKSMCSGIGEPSFCNTK